MAGTSRRPGSLRDAGNRGPPKRTPQHGLDRGRDLVGPGPDRREGLTEAVEFSPTPKDDRLNRSVEPATPPEGVRTDHRRPPPGGAWEDREVWRPPGQRRGSHLDSPTADEPRQAAESRPPRRSHGKGVGLRIQRLRTQLPEHDANAVEGVQLVGDRAEGVEPNPSQREVELASLTQERSEGRPKGCAIRPDEQQGWRWSAVWGCVRNRGRRRRVHAEGCDAEGGASMRLRDAVRWGPARPRAHRTATIPPESLYSRAAPNSRATPNSVWARSRAGTSWHDRHRAS